MKIVVGGASGFLGRALVAFLAAEGHDVVRLVRSAEFGPDVSRWEPHRGQVDQHVIDDADAVVNLSGSPVAKWPRTAKVRKELVESRLTATWTLAEAVASAPTPPALISASAMGYYGASRPGETLVETSSPGTGFLADLVRQWEAATEPADRAGARVCWVRTSLVLGKGGGLLKPMLPAFKLGLGAKLGDGEQDASLVSQRDWVRAVTFLVESPDLSGPFNVVAPTPATNGEFTRAVAHALHRPAVLAAPAPVIRGALGGLGQEVLGSLRLAPQRLEEAGFTFLDPDVESAARSALV